MRTAISYIECSQVAGLIQKVSKSSLKASVCAAIFQQLSEDHSDYTHHVLSHACVQVYKRAGDTGMHMDSHNYRLSHT